MYILICLAFIATTTAGPLNRCGCVTRGVGDIFGRILTFVIFFNGGKPYSAYGMIQIM